MTSHLIQKASDESSDARLKQIYETGLIAAEKKPFLVDLQKSYGPYLAVANTDDFILDGCSQIATLGLGFNASPLFAPCHHLESWTGDYRTENVCNVARAYRSLLKRLLGFEEYNVHFCSSGAEAVEIGLGLCFANRRNKTAHRVLAFEGSFHGRMMVALASTSNPKKREAFSWPDHQSEFVPYPFIHGNEDVSAAEEASLSAVEQKLLSGEFFAVLLEPMQCEGGDRFSSASFHQRLIKLVRRYGVPIVYDEVQTGFHLGNTFFWHRQFELTDSAGKPVGPDVVCCAKKSQVGVVLSKFDVPYWESFCPASMIRGYAVANILDQFSDRITEIEHYNHERLQALANANSQLISNPRVKGLAFAFDFLDPESVSQFVGRRFPHGLLFYPAGQKTARFRTNLACKIPELDQLWVQIEACLLDKPASEPKPIEFNRAKLEADYDFHQRLIQLQFNQRQTTTSASKSVVDYLKGQLHGAGIANADVHIVDGINYPEFRSRILKMQTQVYEPIRQTPAEEFDLLFEDSGSIGPIAIVVAIDKEIIAMAFCGRLALFAQERGVANDPYLNDDTVFYMVDLTVATQFRGGIGRSMKNAIAMLAVEKGVTAIHGRNRDRLAAGMWAINLSLGSYETQHLRDDYQDENEFRDCIYYRMPLRSSKFTEPDVSFNTISPADLDEDFVSRNLPTMVNKVCLSNFVTESFLEDLQFVSSVMPASLQHVYTASSLSECVDKITKAIWLKRSPANHLLTVEWHYFGEGSFLARSLSGPDDPFFPTSRLKHQNVADNLEAELKRTQPIAFYVQAEQFSGHEEYLCDCVRICRENSIPIVFNETGPRFGTKDQFSRIKECHPDASIVWLGGQMALAFTTADYFADDPLLLISTWDGDAYSLARFAQFIRTQND